MNVDQVLAELAKVPLGWILAILGVIALALSGLHKCWPWLRRAVKLVDTLASLPEDLKKIDDRLSRLEKGKK